MPSSIYRRRKADGLLPPARPRPRFEKRRLAGDEDALPVRFADGLTVSEGDELHRGGALRPLKLAVRAADAVLGLGLDDEAGRRDHARESIETGRGWHDGARDPVTLDHRGTSPLTCGDSGAERLPGASRSTRRPGCDPRETSIPSSSSLAS